VSHIATYLRDQMTGSVLAIDLQRHPEETHADCGHFLAQLRQDIEADRDELMALMERLAISAGTFRGAVA
jgi:hypothetical protein